MSVIYKYVINKLRQTRVPMPAGGKILSLQVQDNSACIWVLAEPKNEMVIRVFETFPTGQDIDATGMQYIGTFQLDSYVGHVFEHIGGRK